MELRYAQGGPPPLLRTRSVRESTIESRAQDILFGCGRLLALNPLLYFALSVACRTSDPLNATSAVHLCLQLPGVALLDE